MICRLFSWLFCDSSFHFKDDDEFDVPKNEFEIDEEDVEIESVDDFEDIGTNQEGITLGDTLMDPVEDEFDDEEFENMPGNTNIFSHFKTLH